MLDTRPALADMASQIRSCRTSNGFTLQQLATRSGVAASTIHKVESQLMVPTISILLKIASGLDRRPEELIRDEISTQQSTGVQQSQGMRSSASPACNTTRRHSAAWRIDLDRQRPFPSIVLAPDQRAMLLVETGRLDVQAGGQRFDLGAADCLEIEGGGRIESPAGQPDSARIVLVVSPPGDLDLRLGALDVDRPARP